MGKAELSSGEEKIKEKVVQALFVAEAAMQKAGEMNSAFNERRAIVRATLAVGILPLL